MTEPSQTHSYGLGEPVAFEDPTSGWVDYVTGEIVALLDDGQYRIRIDVRDDVVTLPGYLLSPLNTD